MKRAIALACLLFAVVASGVGGHVSPLAVGVAHADACNDGGEWPNCTTECAITGNACDEGSDGDTDYGWICATTGNDCPEEPQPEPQPIYEGNPADGGGGGFGCSGLTGNPNGGAVALNGYWIPDPESFNALGQDWGGINWCGEPNGGTRGQYLSVNASLGTFNGPMLRPGYEIILIPGFKYKGSQEPEPTPAPPPRKGKVTCNGNSVASPIGIIVVTGFGQMTCKSDVDDDPVTGMSWVLCLEVKDGDAWIKTWQGCVGGELAGDAVAESITVNCNPGRYANNVWRAVYTGTATTPRGGYLLWQATDVIPQPSFCRATELPPPAVPPLP